MAAHLRALLSPSQLGPYPLVFLVADLASGISLIQYFERARLRLNIDWLCVVGRPLLDSNNGVHDDQDQQDCRNDHEGHSPAPVASAHHAVTVVGPRPSERTYDCQGRYGHHKGDHEPYQRSRPSVCRCVTSPDLLPLIFIMCRNASLMLHSSPSFFVVPVIPLPELDVVLRSHRPVRSSPLGFSSALVPDGSFSVWPRC